MKTRLPLILLILAAFLTSCQVTEDLALSGTGGSSASDIHVEPFFLDVLYDFSQFLPEEEPDLMASSLKGFAKDLGRKGASEPSFESTGENTYLLTFGYEDAGAFLGSYGISGEGLVSQGGSSFTFHLDIDNYGELKKIVPFLDDPNFEVYGPEYNQGMSEEDYLDMIYFLLGEEGPEAITEGQVKVSITAPGTIVEAVNAEKTSENTVTASIPLISFLLLNEPIEFSATWN